MSNVAVATQREAQQYLEEGLTVREPKERRILNAEVLRQRISAGKLLTRLVAFALGNPEDTVCSNCGHLEPGVDMTMTQLGATKLALSKVLPDLAAVSIEVTDNRPPTKADIDAMALAQGLNPDDLWAQAGANKPDIEGESAGKQGEPVDSDPVEPSLDT